MLRTPTALMTSRESQELLLETAMTCTVTVKILYTMLMLGRMTNDLAGVSLSASALRERSQHSVVIPVYANLMPNTSEWMPLCCVIDEASCNSPSFLSVCNETQSPPSSLKGESIKHIISFLERRNIRVQTSAWRSSIWSNGDNIVPCFVSLFRGL